MVDAATSSYSTARDRWHPRLLRPPPGAADVAIRLRLEAVVRTGTMTGGLLGMAGAMLALSPAVALVVVAGVAACYALWLVAFLILAVKRPRHCITMGILHMDIRPAPKDQSLAVHRVGAPHDDRAAATNCDPGGSL